MVCAACGVVNDPARRFCKECGSRLSVACPSCGAGNDPGDKFCGQCGSLLAAGQPFRSAEPAHAADAPGARDPETERRVVSVLFVDLVGFTTFSEGHDAEDVRAMLTRYFDAATDAVQRHGGTVEKFIGDAVMAVWGTPIAHEDDAERAVRCALEIVDRVKALGASLDLDLLARAGVLTGEAVAMRDAVDQGIVTGDLVNTASRLQSAAQPGTVLVGERTYRSVSDSIACIPVEPLSLKGKAEQLPAWEAQRVLSEMGGSNRGVAPEPPFVGREEELRLAKELLGATGRERRPRLLHITGVAGIGKSRLVWELQKYVDGLTEMFRWHQGRCPSYGEGVTFWALSEMIRGRAGIADTDDADTMRARLTRCLEEFVPNEEERRWIESRLGQLVGLDGLHGSSTDRDELFGAWRRFFELVAEHGTAVLVFEDLHWADPGLLDFIESLLEWSRTSPIIVLTLARPDLSDRRPTWGVGVRSSSTLHLEQLADDDIASMVSGYVEGLPAKDLDRLVERAEGVPMYAVETVRMLAARGALEQTAQSYRVVGDLGGELDIPETLHALVAARLDGLPDAERSLVQDASVAGHTFTLLAVSAVAGRPVAELEPLLRALVRKQVLDQDVDPRSPERGQYRFVQSVIHEVAYSTLSKSARRQKHLACARWSESLGEDELASVVANHYLEAYRSDPGGSDAEEIAEHAREWLQRAGDRAAGLGSPEQAYRYARQVLTLATTPADRASGHHRAALAAGSLGLIDTTLTHLWSASAEYENLGDPAAEALLLTRVHRINFVAEHRTALSERMAEVESRLSEDSKSERVELLSAMADDAANAQDVAAALQYSERALVLAQTMDRDDVVRTAANSRAFALHVAGRHYEAHLFFQDGAEAARRGGTGVALARALMTFSVTQMEDDPRASHEAILECAAVSEKAGLRPLQGLALANAAEGAVDLGEWEIADRALAELALLSNQEGADDDGAVMTAAMLTAHRGDPQDALATLSALEARRSAGWNNLVQMQTWFLRSKALCSFLAADPDASAEAANASLAMDPAGSNAPLSLWVAVQSAAARRDADALRAALGATSTLRGRWITQIRRTAVALLGCLDDEEGAADLLLEALDAWITAELPLDHAAATLGAIYVRTTAVPVEHVERARRFLTGLQATSMLSLYDAASA